MPVIGIQFQINRRLKTRCAFKYPFIYQKAFSECKALRVKMVRVKALPSG